jgi:histidine triad (HIT) family protein
MSDCIFCQIVAGTSPSHKVWEDEHHLAFLSIFPNTEGVTVVIPKTHQDSYIFKVDSAVMTELMMASKKVAQLLDTAFPDSARTAVVFEGFGVNHLHAKLFPLHGTAQPGEWKKISSDVSKYFDHYEGYVSSHDYQRADDTALAAIAAKIRDAV